MPTKIQHDILTYQDYRLFLNDFVSLKKKTDTNWSVGSWAKSLGLKSTSSITKILNNHRLPGPQITRSLIKYFKFNDKESSYFEDLIQIEKIKDDSGLKSLLLERLSKNNKSNLTHFIDFKAFEVLSQWYHIAIREMSRIKNFKNSAVWINKNLRFRVNEKKISSAIDNLINLQLMKKSGTKLIASHGNLSTSEDIQNLAIQKYHCDMLENAKSGLKSIDIKEREYLSGTLCFDKEKLPQAKKMLRNFLDEFGQCMDSDNGNEVYQVQLQFFPLTNLSQKDN